MAPGSRKIPEGFLVGDPNVSAAPIAIDSNFTQADPWKHRAKGMACGTCMWFVPKAASQEHDDRPGDPFQSNGRLGRCRRHAPTMGGYPAVFETDWCGDHKLDENKLHG